MPSRLLFKRLGTASPYLKCACRLVGGYNLNIQILYVSTIASISRSWLAVIFSLLLKRERLIGGEKMPPCYPCIIVDWFL